MIWINWIDLKDSNSNVFLLRNSLTLNITAKELGRVYELRRLVIILMYAPDRVSLLQPLDRGKRLLEHFDMVSKRLSIVRWLIVQKSLWSPLVSHVILLIELSDQDVLLGEVRVFVLEALQVLERWLDAKHLRQLQNWLRHRKFFWIQLIALSWEPSLVHDACQRLQMRVWWDSIRGNWTREDWVVPPAWSWSWVTHIHYNIW